MPADLRSPSLLWVLENNASLGIKVVPTSKLNWSKIAFSMYREVTYTMLVKIHNDQLRSIGLENVENHASCRNMTNR